MKDIFKLNSSLQSLSTKCLFRYIIDMTDTLIVKNCARYCYDILNVFDTIEESIV